MIEIAFNDLKLNKKDLLSFNEICVNRYRGNSTSSYKNLYQIVKTNINIQIPLARYYLLKNKFGEFSTVEFSYFVTDDPSREIRNFNEIFEEVDVYSYSSGSPFYLQISKPRDSAYKVIRQLYNTNEIDQTIRDFYFNRQIQSDCTRNMYFQISPKGVNIERNDLLEYVINGSKNVDVLNPMYIDISGFRLDEIEDNDIVQQLATQVDFLYLMVFNLRISDENSYFCKQLRWYIK